MPARGRPQLPRPRRLPRPARQRAVGSALPLRPPRRAHRRRPGRDRRASAIRLVVDYRGPHEHETTPSRIAPDGPIRRHDRADRRRHRRGRLALGRDHRRDAAVASTRPTSPRSTSPRCGRRPTSSARSSTMLAEPEHLPAVFHCTAARTAPGSPPRSCSRPSGSTTRRSSTTTSSATGSAPRSASPRSVRPWPRTASTSSGSCPLFSAPRPGDGGGARRHRRDLRERRGATSPAPPAVAPATLDALRDHLLEP